jgi:hypothetical protein
MSITNIQMLLAVLWLCSFAIFMVAVYLGKHPENAVSTTMLYALGVLSGVIAFCEILELFA